MFFKNKVLLNKSKINQSKCLKVVQLGMVHYSSRDLNYGLSVGYSSHDQNNRLKVHYSGHLLPKLRTDVSYSNAPLQCLSKT